MIEELMSIIDKKIKDLDAQYDLTEKLNMIAYKYFEEHNKDYDNDDDSPWPYIEEDQMILSQVIACLRETKKILTTKTESNLNIREIKKLIKKYSS